MPHWMHGIFYRWYARLNYVHGEEDITQDAQKEYEIAVQKRAEHIPLQYIIGEQEFMGLRFKVNSNVLIPRQDTETLVEQVLKIVKPGMKVLDLCTGSGCVLISVLKNAPELTGMGSDISKAALLVAKENAKLHEVDAEWVRSDLFDNITETFDVIMANPPYIPTGEILSLMPEVRDFEPMEALDGKALAEKMAQTDSAILLTGESGTGKELFAQAIHSASLRRDGPFIAVNCAALTETLLESELFGYVEGAFTGAKKGGKPGLFECAHQGTLFLDEISELPLLLQGKRIYPV